MVFLFPRLLQNTHLCAKENSADYSVAAATVPIFKADNYHYLKINYSLAVGFGCKTRHS
jgi:hypothetical protein